MSKPIIRTLDIETAPNLAHVWARWKQNIAMNQIMEEDYIMSFAYTDLGKDYAYYYENQTKSDKQITRQLVKALDEADIVVGHNFNNFDDRWIIGRAISYGIKPPSPYKIIDTMVEAKKAMRLKSYRLVDLAKTLGCDPKSSHAKFPGHSLWTECMAGNQEAWKEMQEYNIQDVFTTEEVYLALRPYMRTHPNIGTYLQKEETVCGRCGSEHLQWRGYYYTNAGQYAKFQCQDCGGWGSLRNTEYPKDRRKALGKNVR